jgi:hypothetical protein
MIALLEEEEEEGKKAVVAGHLFETTSPWLLLRDLLV